jgi:hypothetical protein
VRNVVNGCAKVVSCHDPKLRRTRRIDRAMRRVVEKSTSSASYGATTTGTFIVDPPAIMVAL